jgi:tartrate dehydratase alpha subunit/fumarate hydratase class I-like protein
MPDEVTKINEVKTTSDGTVKISVEKYNELLEKAAVKPPVINRTTVNKTAEMLAKETRMWGGGLMGLGASLFVLGACVYKAGLSKS